jgi:hypothetical protein
MINKAYKLILYLHYQFYFQQDLHLGLLENNCCIVFSVLLANSHHHENLKVRDTACLYKKIFS